MPTKLGQNFLTDENIARKIIYSANISRANVLEIGPGKGILTKHLAEYAGKVVAVEIDHDLTLNLQTKYPNVEMIEGDILRINLPKIIGEKKFNDYKVVANLPYYITSKIIRLFLETKHPPREMILMVQKEVGERIVALDGKESLLSISVKFYADPEILFRVGRENFSPSPEVDSVVIRIKRKNIIPNANPKDFFRLVRTGFASKRKTLANNLSAGLHLPKYKIAEAIEKSGTDPGIRAEKLQLENWLFLFEHMEV